jgi:hypothetical protein
VGVGGDNVRVEVERTGTKEVAGVGAGARVVHPSKMIRNIKPRKNDLSLRLIMVVPEAFG